MRKKAGLGELLSVFGDATMTTAQLGCPTHHYDIVETGSKIWPGSVAHYASMTASTSADNLTEFSKWAKVWSELPLPDHVDQLDPGDR